MCDFQKLVDLGTLGHQFGWTKGAGNWSAINRAISTSQPVQVIQDCGSDQWQSQLPVGHLLQFGFPELHENRPIASARVWISAIQRRFSKTAPKAQWHPRVLYVGINCSEDATAELIEFAIEQVCRKVHLATGSIATLATLNPISKGVLSLNENKSWPLQAFSFEQLSDTQNTPNVTEALAGLAATEQELILGEIQDPVIRVKNTVIERSELKGQVEIAIAQSFQEYIPLQDQKL
ncbi:MAG: hypothetical protein F6K11_02360 [Leptolyngbya sp. SIO3F4]|nr:hypothetical protein [Leptolyngbya sp. SIO3F4]